MTSQRIFFIGPGGSGKSTLAQQLGEVKQIPYFDLDEMFCNQIENVRIFIRKHGYQAYSQRNGKLLLNFLETPPSRMVLALSSGILSEDMAEPMRSILLSRVRTIGSAFLIVPHPDDETAADMVAKRQIGRGFGLEYDRERLKYLRRIAEYRSLNFPKIVGSQTAPISVKQVLFEIDRCDC